MAIHRRKADTMIAVIAGTQNHVLMEALRPIGPNVLLLLAGVECSPIHVFSDIGPYGTSHADSQLASTPDPSVKCYLQSQTETTAGGRRLVVVDAAGPGEPLLYAAPMESAESPGESNGSRHRDASVDVRTRGRRVSGGGSVCVTPRANSVAVEMVHISLNIRGARRTDFAAKFAANSSTALEV